MNNNIKFLFVAIIYQIIISIFILLFIYIFHKENSLSWIFSAWDAHHYQFLAQYGYQTTGDEANFIVFFPLYPLLIKLTSFFIPNFIIASLFVNFIFSIFAHFIVILIIDSLNTSKYQKCLSIVLFFISPISVYFFAAYTESVYLFLVSSFFFLLIKKKYYLASLSVFFAALCRNVGISLIIPFILQIVINEKRRAFKYLPLVLFILISPFLYLFINFQVWGDPFYYQKVLVINWHKKVINPLDNIMMLIREFPDYLNHEILTYTIDYSSIIFLFLIIFIYLFLKKKCIPITWIIWMLVNWFIILSQSFLLSSARYIFILFPIYIILPAILPQKKMLKYISTIILIISFLYLAVLGLYLYAVGAWIY